MNTMTRLPAIALAALPFVAACAPAPTLTDYRPVADAAGPAFERDLAECRAIAASAEAAYTKRQNDQMAANIIGGLIAGAVVGQVVGGNSDWTAYGAASGAAQGAAATDTELAQGGPRRVIDRCLIGRGHRVLSDLGVGA